MTSGTDILALISQRHADTPLREVRVPEFGCSLYFRPMTGAEQASIRAGIPLTDMEMLNAKALIVKALDANGQRVFQDDASTLATILGKLDYPVLQRILNEAGGAAPLAGAAAKN